MRTYLSTLLFTLLWPAFSFSPVAELEPSSDEPAGVFIQEDPANVIWYVTLELDLNALFEQKKTNNYFPAKFSFKDPNGEMVHWDIKIRCRGRFRRMECEFPPLKIKFPKKEMKAAGYGKHNDVKLVTHCAEDKTATENLFREYLTYKMYAKLTDVRFRTQLIQVTYKDTGTGEETVTYGVFIEDIKALAARTDAKECKECYGLTPIEFESSNLQIHDLFQYMIGNTDWRITTAKNLKILNPKDENAKRLIAPYDFDFSGLVNANYARPNPDYQQVKIRDRIYLGGNWPAEEWTTTIQHYQDKKVELLETIQSFELLNNKARKDMAKYVNSFYKELDKGYIPVNMHFN